MDKIFTQKERILYFIEKQHIKKVDFFNNTGVSYANFKGIALKSELGGEKIAKILTVYPQLSSDWLVIGKGDMLSSYTEYKTQDRGTVGFEEPTRSYKSSSDSIPLIPISAMAGAFTGEMQILEHECERFVIPTFKGADFLISVKGSSMNPKYNSGDIIACKRLPIDTFFQWHKVYVLDTDQGALVKRVKKGKTPDELIIESDNPNYEPFELHRSKIYHIALVIGVVRLE